MKNILIYTLLLTIFSSCEVEQGTSKLGNILEGKHELRRFKTVTEEGQRWSASYFIIAGGGSGGTYKNTKASFSWKMNTGEYAISELELGKIRVKIDSTVTTPYVIFNWQRCPQSHPLGTYFIHYVNYMVICCKEEDYPININITDL